MQGRIVHSSDESMDEAIQKRLWDVSLGMVREHIPEDNSGIPAEFIAIHSLREEVEQ